MSAVKYVANIVKSPFNYFLFLDGVLQQRKFATTAKSIGCDDLVADVRAETKRNFTNCTVVPTLIHGAVYLACAYLESRGALRVGETFLAGSVCLAAELCRGAHRNIYFNNAQRVFDWQVELHLREEPRTFEELKMDSIDLESRL